MLIGYARAVEDDKTRRKQVRALKEAGCTRIVKESCSRDTLEDASLDSELDGLNKGDTLVVWRLDCLADSLKELIAIVTRINRAKANLHSLSDEFSVSAHGGRAMLGTLHALSDFQYSLIKQRTIQGLREARAQGRVGGRPRKLGPREIRKAEAMLNKAQMTKTEVASHFGVCRQTLNQALAAEAQH